MSSASLHARFSKAFRVRTEGVRRLYVTARRAERFLRDAPRRAVLQRLPVEGAVTIPYDEGFTVLPAARFEEVPGVIAEARRALERFDAATPPEGKNRKRFLVNVLDPSALTRDSAVIRLALREDVLAGVSRYLGVVPFLSAISVFLSDVVEGVPTSSQLHHCDGDDVTQVKVFVYCSDVQERSGPLTVLDATSSARVRRAVGYQFRQRLTDAQVRGVVGPGRERAIVGPCGTTAFVDTSRCLHYGSRVAPDAPPRLVTMIQYQTPYSFMLPTSAQGSLPFRRLIDPSLSPLQRLVLGE
jgi:hypothetical protein